MIGALEYQVNAASLSDGPTPIKSRHYYSTRQGTNLATGGKDEEEGDKERKR